MSSFFRLGCIFRFQGSDSERLRDEPFFEGAPKVSFGNLTESLESMFCEIQIAGIMPIGSEVGCPAGGGGEGFELRRGNLTEGSGHGPSEVAPAKSLDLMEDFFFDFGNVFGVRFGIGAEKSRTFWRHPSVGTD